MTKLHVISDGAQTWLNLTTAEHHLLQANVDLKAMKPGAGGDVGFESGYAVLERLAQLCYLRGWSDAIDAMEARAAEQEGVNVAVLDSIPEPRRRLTPLEEAEQKVLVASDEEIARARTE